MITVIGLGLSAGDLTVNAAEKIRLADKVYVKTAKTPTYNFFADNGIAAESFDDAYDEAEDFDSLNQKIIEKLLAEGKDEQVVFCVNGNGGDDGTVQLLMRKTDIKVIPAAGFADYGAAVLADTSYSCYAAYDVVGGKPFIPDKRHTVIIREIDNRYLASDLKIILMGTYGDEKEVILSDAVDMTGKMTRITLSDLDRQNAYGYATTLIIPSENFLSAKRHDFYDLIDIMENLLGENGCPWDRAQTHESIRSNLIEEAYELVDAIDKGDLGGMIEESGDVLLQAVFHCMLGKVEGEYDYTDALSNLCQKLITRHTHIFGENHAENAEQALDYWTAAKSVEKEYASYTDKMEKLPKNLPALLYAYKMQKIAVKCGFDWHDVDGTYDKLNEEIKEFKEADGEQAVMEAGDLLFSAINPMRWRHIDPEIALKAACEKFLNRFRYMEENITSNGEDISDEATRDKYWAEAKKLYK